MSAFEHPPFVPDDRYEILGVIGRGGFSVVYLARDKWLPRKVALKYVRWDRDFPDGLRSWFVERFRSESRISAALNHPYMIGVHDFHDDPEHPCLVLEYIEGRTLKQLVRETPKGVGREKLLHIFTCICEAVTFAHSRRIVHGDIKPENVLIGKRGEIKLIDYGLSFELGILEVLAIDGAFGSGSTSVARWKKCG